MPMQCPGCGVENRDGARFCRICQTKLSNTMPVVGVSAPPLPPTPPPPGTIITVLPQPPAPQQPGGVPGSPGKTAAGTTAGVILRGNVVGHFQTEGPPPRDSAKLATILGIGLLVMPVVLWVIILGVAVVLTLVFLGVGACAFVLMAAMGVLGRVTTIFVPKPRPEGQRVTKMKLDVEDGAGVQHAVELYGPQIAGQIKLGDVVDVYGEHLPNGFVRAYRVDVRGRSGAVISPFQVEADRPWPMSVAVGTWFFVVLFALYLLSNFT